MIGRMKHDDEMKYKPGRPCSSKRSFPGAERGWQLPRVCRAGYILRRPGGDLTHAKIAIRGSWLLFQPSGGLEQARLGMPFDGQGVVSGRCLPAPGNNKGNKLSFSPAGLFCRKAKSDGFWWTCFSDITEVGNPQNGLASGIC